MKSGWTRIALGVLAASLIAPAAVAQKKVGSGETRLIGVSLFDSGVKIVSLYGSPDQIQAVSIGGGATGGGPAGGPSFGGPAGRPGGGFGGPAGSPGALPPPGGGGKGAAGAAGFSPFSFGDDLLRQGLPTAEGAGGAAVPQAGSSGGPGPSRGGLGPGTPAAGGGAAETATFTRWIYNRGGSKYGFVLDKAGRVVQIEAIGMTNPKVRTQRGIGFGNTFAQIVKKYGTPDSYEISGDQIMMRYLTRHKVAFRLTRLQDKKPHVVTGVVVAAGKG